MSSGIVLLLTVFTMGGFAPSAFAEFPASAGEAHSTSVGTTTFLKRRYLLRLKNTVLPYWSSYRLFIYQVKKLGFGKNGYGTEFFGFFQFGARVFAHNQVVKFAADTTQ